MALSFAEKGFVHLPRHLARLRALRASVPAELRPPVVEYATSPEPTPFSERTTLTYRRARRGTDWGGAFTCGWFHVTGRVPAGVEHPALILDTDGEGTVYSSRGELLTSISSRVTPIELLHWSRGKNVLPLDDHRLIGPDGDFDVWIDTSFNGKLVQPFGRARIRRLALVDLDSEREGFAGDYLTAVGLLAVARDRARATPAADGTTPPQVADPGDLSRTLDEAWRAWRADDVAGAREMLAPALVGTPDPALNVTAVGHGHLDLAWLWPVRETRRKSKRTYAYQLINANRHPNAVYGTSQPQQLAWLEEQEPELHARVIDAIRSGQFEPQGGFWVEPDTNVPSGESLIRQAVLGQRYWQRWLGHTVDVCWLPDTFGYSANLPQILRGAGMDSFMTIKLTWNEVTDFPHRSFVWRGIDGSEVLVHMPPEGNYNSSAAPVALASLRDNHPEAVIAPEALLVYGSGDGGGGPGPAHHAMLERATSLPGLPAVEHGTAASFFHRLGAHRAHLPVWDGELYLQKHQGTYTTQGAIKKWNRQIEFALHDLEYLAALAWWHGGTDYPQEFLEETWRDHLLFQFHDILPGSSINRVNRETVERQEEMAGALGAATDSLLTGDDPTTPAGPALPAGGGGEHAEGEPSPSGWFVNTTPVTRTGHVKQEGQWYAYDSAPFETAALVPWSAVGGVVATDRTVANQHLAAHWDDTGALISLVAHGREFVGEEFGRLVVHRDPWSYFDAWDIDPRYQDRRTRVLRPESVEVLQDGPRMIRRSRYRHGRSLIQQDVVLTPDSRHLTFETRVDWRETWRMLRAEFVPAMWSDEVTCDIQLGTLRRSTREETDEQRAQFEVCAHRWVDVTAADGSAGLTLMNDSKYGHRAKSGLISLNLLRSPVYPDRRADRGRHEFRYAIFPHLGPVEDSGAAELALDFNAPRILARSPLPGWLEGPAPFTVHGEGVWLDVVKASDDGRGIVLRLHETQGREVSVELGVHVPFGRIVECDLLERSLPGVGPVDPSSLEFGPFQIRTFRVERPRT